MPEKRQSMSPRHGPHPRQFVVAERTTMSSPSPHGLSSPMYLRLIEAFNKPADDAGILQGVRKFRSGLPHVRVVLSASPKNGGKFIPCEGRLEAAFAQALEVDPEVAAYRTQPFSFPGPNGRSLVCDFAVKWVNYTYSVVDIKPKGHSRCGV